ncbi:hypothetical protein TBLA_0B05800 [Henningerozyma blattae CBS 6284]|uniref:Mitochondrial outer membrane protein porin n=1 Tax=Henningerozyma blattae (strain ATCC 34711 / CBS 6284 / DSM 70876 / NBRC 10599 / NRRL Y-10934 / UCD 77-7) TaxID=1071380 RepID=I2GZ54_HENB6|nr:hypothetical protein TBLA_0B05800 [Tetrapisispora blattae CBS 6284]CCH59406.1 hypothetical protein TBLA_0B05800 [Tetrapisispora blattae CBS 6284]
MAPPFFSGISKDINGLLNNDFYHSQVAQVEVSTTASNGVKFNVKAKQPAKDAPLNASIESKFFDKASGLNLTQSWSNSNNLTTKLELAELTPGLKTELQTSLIPNISKNAKLNLSFVQQYFAAKGSFDLLKSPVFVGDLTVAHDGIVAGAEFGYDISQGNLSRYALALGYNSKEYTLTCSTNNKNLTSVSFFQKVSPILQVGAKATTSSNPAPAASGSTASSSNQSVNIEFATKYNPDTTSQIKAKLNDNGALALSYKQTLQKGISLGFGTSFNVLKLSEPVHQLGVSLSFTS